MNNPQPGSNETPKTPVPSETKPAPQQAQDDGKLAAPKPDQQK